MDCGIGHRTHTRYPASAEDKLILHMLTQRRVCPCSGLLKFKSLENAVTAIKAMQTGEGARPREHAHLPIPSLLMRARVLATVRVWKKRLEHQAHSRSDIRGGCGLPVTTGAEP